MRHLLLALMIALLPVRGWVGDAMAISMLAHGPAAASAEVAMAAGTDHHPCPDHAAAPPDTQVSGGPADDHQNRAHAHSACDVCNGPAMNVSSPTATAAPASHTLLAALSESFASSEPRQGTKPPIS